jgi:hypothetical protein
VAVILLCGVVGLVVMPPTFRALNNPAPAPGGAHALAEGATDGCPINGSVFVRSLTSTCRSSPATGDGRIHGVTVPQRRAAELVRNRRVRGRVAEASPRSTARAPVAPEVGRVPMPPSPTPAAPVVPLEPAPTPVAPPVVVPPLELTDLLGSLDPLLGPANVELDPDLDLDVGLDLGPGL